MYLRQSTGLGVHLQRGADSTPSHCAVVKKRSCLQKRSFGDLHQEINTRDDYHWEFKMLPTHPKVPPCDMPRLTQYLLRQWEEGLPGRLVKTCPDAGGSGSTPSWETEILMLGS